MLVAAFPLQIKAIFPKILTKCNCNMQMFLFNDVKFCLAIFRFCTGGNGNTATVNYGTGSLMSDENLLLKPLEFICSFHRFYLIVIDLNLTVFIFCCFFFFYITYISDTVSLMTSLSHDLSHWMWQSHHPQTKFLRGQRVRQAFKWVCRCRQAGSRQVLRDKDGRHRQAVAHEAQSHKRCLQL